MTNSIVHCFTSSFVQICTKAMIRMAGGSQSHPLRGPALPDLVCRFKMVEFDASCHDGGRFQEAPGTDELS